MTKQEQIDALEKARALIWRVVLVQGGIVEQLLVVARSGIQHAQERIREG